MSGHKITIIIVYIILRSLFASASILGGEITYTHVSGNMYTIFLALYFDGPAPVELTFDSLHTGDGSTIVMNRDSVVNLYASIYAAYFHTTYTYAGPGIDTIWTAYSTRPGDIINVPNSFYTPFAISSVVRPGFPGCPNSSIRFADPPIWTSPLNKICKHSVTVLNPDHDSLSFELVEPRGVAGYIFPNHFYLDPVSGELTTVGLPDSVGRYDFAIKVREWRNGIEIGYVVRDYVLEILPDNFYSYDFVQPSLQIDTGGNYFIHGLPGDTIAFDVEYFDTLGNSSLNSSGEGFEVGSPASITSTTNSDTVLSSFYWITDSTHARNFPYLFTFRGDNGFRQTDLMVLVYVDGQKPDSCYASTIGIEEQESLSFVFNVYPNPVEDILHIDFKDNDFKSGEIKIFDAFGKLVSEKKKIGGDIEINTESFSSGVYFIRFELDGNFSTKRFCKVH